MVEREISIRSGDPTAICMHLAQAVGAIANIALRLDPGAPERATIADALMHLRNHAEALGRTDILPVLDRNWANAR